MSKPSDEKEPPRILPVEGYEPDLPAFIKIRRKRKLPKGEPPPRKRRPLP